MSTRTHSDDGSCYERRNKRCRKCLSRPAFGIFIALRLGKDFSHEQRNVTLAQPIDQFSSRVRLCDGRRNLKHRDRRN